MQGHPNNIVLEATRPKKRRKLSKIEWLSLLAVNVEGRSVSKQQRNQLQQALESEEAQTRVRPLQVQPPHYPCKIMLSCYSIFAFIGLAIIQLLPTSGRVAMRSDRGEQDSAC
jgi:hypothetical protein